MSMSSCGSVGIDIVNISRFLSFEKNRSSSFLKKVFYEDEQFYCFSYSNPGVHLAGIFAAKEAVSKALGPTQYPFFKIEIKHSKDGRPEAWFQDSKLHVSVSISHTNEIATAIAIA